MWTTASTSSTASAAGAGAPSEPASFVTGLFAQADWGEAEWIDAGACSESADLTTTGNCSGGLLRTEFEVPAAAGGASSSSSSGLTRASLFVSACQYYELYVHVIRCYVSSNGCVDKSIHDADC